MAQENETELLEAVEQWAAMMQRARQERDAAIRRAHAAGVGPKQLGFAADLSAASIHRILNS